MQKSPRRRLENNDQEQILVIIGATGSGKTGLGVLAAKGLEQKYGRCAEIISADSRAIYRGMDIGTAKPSAEEQQGVKHWGIDLVYPDERFTVVDFQRYAKGKIKEILARGHEPIIVGGTGLYIDALVYGYKFNNDVKKTCSDRQEMCAAYKILGIEWPRDELCERLLLRSYKLFEQDIEKETLVLSERYGWDRAAMSADIYPIVRRMIAGEISREEAIRLNAIKDWQLAKRQRTWFRRNPNIVWRGLKQAETWINDFFIEKFA